MANFAQTTPQTFTPYIPKFNTQLYAQIGMQRQQQYDDNVEKIQSYIDTVSGIQVSRDVDKKYLEDKINNMRSDIEGLVGSDFSLNKVMRTARGYISNVANDRNIQAAVMSSMNKQKDIEAMNTAVKEGKASLSNTHDVLKRISAYDNSTQLGEVYQAKGYTPYYNRAEAFNKWYKDKRGNVIVEDTPLGTNSDGTPNYRAYTLINGKREYLDSAAVASDYQTFLMEDMQAQQQFLLDTQYYVDTTSDESSAALLRNTYDSAIKDYTKKIDEYSTLIASTTGEEQRKYQDRYDTVLAQKQELDTRFAESKALLETDPQAFKANAFRQSVITGVANRYAYLTTEQTLKKNPQAEMEFTAQGLDLRRQAQEETRRNNIFNNQMKLREVELKELESKGLSGGSAMPLFFNPENISSNFTAMKARIAEEGAVVIQEQIDLIGSLESDSNLPPSQRSVVYNKHTGRYMPNPNNPDAWKEKFSLVEKQYNDNPSKASATTKQYMEGGAYDRKWTYEGTVASMKGAIDEWEATLTPEQREAQVLLEGLKSSLPPVVGNRPDPSYNSTQEQMVEYIDEYVSTGDVKMFKEKYGVKKAGIVRSDINDISEPSMSSLGRGVVSPVGFFLPKGGLKKIESEYKRTGLSQKQQELTERIYLNYPVSTKVDPYVENRKNPSLGMVVRLAQQQGNKEFDKALKMSGGRVDMGYNVDQMSGKITVSLRPINSGEFMGSMELTPEQAIALGQGDMLIERRDAPYRDAINRNNMIGTNIGTTIGQMRPIVNPRSPSSGDYVLEGHIKEYGGQYQPIIRYKSKKDESRGWQTLTPQSSFPTIDGAVEYIKLLQSLDTPSLETKFRE